MTVKILLPCPFCGKRLERSHVFSTRNSDFFAHPSSDGEDQCIAENINVVVYKDGQRDATKRLDAWNRRTSVDGGEE